MEIRRHVTGLDPFGIIINLHAEKYASLWYKILYASLTILFGRMEHFNTFVCV